MKFYHICYDCQNEQKENPLRDPTGLARAMCGIGLVNHGAPVVNCPGFKATEEYITRSIETKGW